MRGGRGVACGELRQCVAAARRRQLDRNGVLNARLLDADLWDIVALQPHSTTLLKEAVNKWRLSARSTVRVLKVARTIADLASSDELASSHLAEALQLRCLDRPL